MWGGGASRCEQKKCVGCRTSIFGSKIAVARLANRAEFPHFQRLKWKFGRNAIAIEEFEKFDHALRDPARMTRVTRNDSATGRAVTDHRSERELLRTRQTPPGFLSVYVRLTRACYLWKCVGAIP